MSLSDKVKYYLSNEDTSEITSITDDIKGNVSTLLQLVETLGDGLSSSDVGQRRSSTELLVAVLQQLNSAQLANNEVSVLITFFCDRLKDHHSIQPVVLQGLSKLSENVCLSAQNVLRIYQEINKEIHVQSLNQSDRRHIYVMTNYLLSNRLQDLLEIGADFVFMYIQIMDGEKDPRNLQLAFQIVTILGQHFPLGVFAEDLFEVVACYFPIEFTPPPNDPHGITREQLVLGLRGCLASTQRFADFCLPMLLEKASSSVQTAKIEAFKTLAACCGTYGAYALREFLPSLWSAAEREVIASLSDTLERSAKAAVTAIVQALATEDQQKGKQRLMDGFIKDAFNDILPYLKGTNPKLLPASSKLLTSLFSGSPYACSHVIQLALPVLIDKFHAQTQDNLRQGYLEILLSLVKTSKTTCDFSDNPLLQYKEQLLSIFQTMTSHENAMLRTLAVPGLVGLLSITNMVNEKEQEQIVSQFSDMILHDMDKTVRQEVLTALVFTSTSLPELLVNKLLPELTTSLSADPMEVSESGDHHAVRGQLASSQVLEVIATVSTNLTVVKATVPVLLQHLQQLSKEVLSDKHKEVIATCESLYTVVNGNAENPSAHAYMYSDVLPQCLLLCIGSAASYVSPAEGSIENCEGASDGQGNVPALCTPDVVLQMARVVQCIACYANQRQSEELMQMATELFINNNPACLKSELKYEVKVGSPWPQQQLLVLFTAIVSSLPAATVPAVFSSKEALFGILLHATPSCARRAAAQALACAFNKLGNVPNLDGSCLLQNTQQDQSLPVEIRRRVLSAFIWVAKATLLASFPQQTQHAAYLLECLKDPDYADVIADGFYIILSESPYVMTSRQHAQIKLMYRQRFFHMVLPSLVKQFNSSTDAVKPHHLSALAYLMRFVPKQVLITELPPILPMLLQSLTVADQPQLWLSTLTAVYDLLLDAPEAFHAHAAEFIGRVLPLTQYKPNMNVRMQALQCLGVMSSFTPHVVLTHKARVLKQLRTVLDDHKRLVRLEATKAVSEWHLLGEPGRK